MSEIDSKTIVILFSVTIGLLVILLVSVVGLRRRLSRVERLLTDAADRRENDTRAAVTSDVSSGGAFETFLGEDPSRRELPKGEQSAEYRKWRQEKGLNWSSP